MDGGKIRFGLHPALLQQGLDPVPVDLLMETDHVDKPAHFHIRGNIRQNHPGHIFQQPVIRRGHRGTPLQYFGQPLQLGQPQGAGKLVQPVIETQPLVFQPASPFAAALVAHAAA